MDSQEIIMTSMGLVQFVFFTGGGWLFKRTVKAMDDRKKAVDDDLATLKGLVLEKDREIERIQTKLDTIREDAILTDKELYELKVRTETQDGIRATEDRKHDDNFIRLEQKVNSKNQTLSNLKEMPEQVKNLSKQMEVMLKELTAAFVRIDELKVCYPRIRRLTQWVSILRERLEQKGEKFSGDWLMPSARDEEIHRHVDYPKK